MTLETRPCSGVGKKAQDSWDIHSFQVDTHGILWNRIYYLDPQVPMKSMNLLTP